MNTEHSPKHRTADYVRLTEEEWHELQPQERIYVAHRGKPWASGTVDQVMADHGIFWVWLDDGGGRVLIHPDGQTAVMRVDGT